MDYQKIINNLEHHARESAEFLAGWSAPDEMESEKAAHQAMVCAIAAIKALLEERDALRDALKFYADRQSYGLGGGSIQRVIVDSGAIARGALRPLPNKK